MMTTWEKGKLKDKKQVIVDIDDKKAKVMNNDHQSHILFYSWGSSHYGWTTLKLPMKPLIYYN